jgi:hypothetical protein
MAGSDRASRVTVVLALGICLAGAVGAQAQRCDLVWTHFGESPVAPGDRLFPGMASDVEAARVVLFGGRLSTRQETWEWFGSTWHRYEPTAAPVRYAHAMAYDAANHRTVMFGGLPISPGGPLMGDTWAWDSPSRTWTPLPTAGPTPRAHAAMAYDAARQRLVLFGGDDGARRGDTWEWVGAGWTQLSSGGPGEPSPRFGHRMAYDAARQRIVLFGGDDGAFRNDTWLWDGTHWVQASAGGPGDPPVRRDHAMAYDVGRQRTVLNGGWAGVELADTWEWDGSAWSQQTGIPGEPIRGSERAMAYDPDYGGVVMLGSHLGQWDTWRLAPREPVRIDRSPVSRAVCPHTDASFGVSATGYPPLQYLWRHNGVSIPGAPSSFILSLHDVALEDAGQYDVIVSDGCTSVTSAPASLSVWATDFTGDGATDIQDFLTFLQLFASGDPRGDFNGDGSLNVQDFLSYLRGFASGC